ncbi:helix-turn-helix domain-containing protein [Cohnella sp.]|uniref:helix-turn-helix domain-containing protein n=1 Tax=Cohnella sp. TaxID=1883426 RepID=UPI003703E564
MYRLLVVDDESFIVDGIYELFEEQAIPELEVYRFYSGKESLKFMESTRADIVLSDIGMPKIDGFQLQAEAKRLWPHCKFIFLTSHNDFHYAQTALRNGSSDFILKTEEDDKIVGSVRHAIAELEDERQHKAFLDLARKQLRMALPILRNEYLATIHDGTIPMHTLTVDNFKDMQIGMSLTVPVLPVIGRVDNWDVYEDQADRTLMKHAIENILAEFFNTLQFQSAAVDKGYFALFIQPGGGQAEDRQSGSRWEQVIAFVKGTLEAAQTVVNKLLRLRISFSVGQQAVPWNELHRHFVSLRKLLMKVPGDEIIVAEEISPSSPLSTNAEHYHHLARKMLKQMNDVEFSNTHQHEQFVDIVEKLKECLAASYSPALFAEIYFSIASFLIAFINRWGADASQESFQLKLLEQSEINRPYSIVLDEFVAIAAALVREKEVEHDQHNHQVIYLLKQYIADHIDQDLSLNQLARIVYLNPAYLSRLYKQATGVGLVDYINDVRLKKAKQSLLETNVKINEISRSVGFESPTYFARLFKRKEGMTPQEFRDRK